MSTQITWTDKRGVSHYSDAGAESFATAAERRIKLAGKSAWMHLPMDPPQTWPAVGPYGIRDAAAHEGTSPQSAADLFTAFRNEALAADELVEAIAAEKSPARRRALARMLVYIGMTHAELSLEFGNGVHGVELRSARRTKLAQRGGKAQTKARNHLLVAWEIARKNATKWTACEIVAQAEKTTPQAVRRAIPDDMYR